MIIDRTQLTTILGSGILPKGDRFDLPRGRRKFRLLSLFMLLTVAAVAAAACKLMSLEPASILLIESCVIIVWWTIAERRYDFDATPTVDQTALRAEVKQWLRERDRND